jgi:hypothetical protein
LTRGALIVFAFDILDFYAFLLAFLFSYKTMQGNGMQHGGGTFLLARAAVSPSYMQYGLAKHSLKFKS